MATKSGEASSSSKSTKASAKATGPDNEQGGAQARRRRPNVDIGLERTADTSQILTEVVSNQAVLWTKLRNYHWNVTGPHFLSLHELFEKQYKAIEKAQDATAERIRSLGHKAHGSLHQFIEHATLRDEERTDLDEMTMVRSLIADHEEVIRGLRQAVEEVEDEHNDKGTGDFLNALMQEHEEMAWMLRAFANQG